jgi:hypothetical protein
MNGEKAGQLAAELRGKNSDQARTVAEIIQRVRPDVLLINEFDFDARGEAAKRFHDNFLAVGQRGQRAIEFEHRYLAAVNTGQPSGHDLNNDGRPDGPGDAFGFGKFPGQYGMLVLSRYPIEQDMARTFRKFLWKEMPNARLPLTSQGPYYSEEQLEVFRLSSKSHWDLPIRIDGQRVHFLCAHPTPPVFDGPEDRNGKRNHDEIRLWADYIDPGRSDYIYDDGGKRNGLSAGTHFVIAGDMNSDPHDGDSLQGSINQLLSHRLIDASFVPTSRGAREKSSRDRGANEKHCGHAAHDTSDFNDQSVGNLRLDYVLPSRTMKIVSGGVFWPVSEESGHKLLEASDHRLVWIDVEFLTD